MKMRKILSRIGYKLELNERWELRREVGCEYFLDNLGDSRWWKQQAEIIDPGNVRVEIFVCYRYRRKEALCRPTG